MHAHLYFQMSLFLVAKVKRWRRQPPFDFRVETNMRMFPVAGNISTFESSALAHGSRTTGKTLSSFAWRAISAGRLIIKPSLRRWQRERPVLR
jgi:hypothetical protein